MKEKDVYKNTLLKKKLQLPAGFANESIKTQIYHPKTTMK